jgi:hypothetical protein
MASGHQLCPEDLDASLDGPGAADQGPLRTSSADRNSVTKRAPPSPFQTYFRIGPLVERNPQLFRTDKAAYYFLEQHADELIRRGAIIRLGSSDRAPILVHEPTLLSVCRGWAQR